MIVKVETTMVYRTPAGRRFFTAKAAYRRAARDRIRAKYPCECEPEVGFVCARHREREHFERLAKRLARWMRAADGRTQATKGIR